MSPPRILIVEDDAPLAAMIRDYLGQRGYVATVEGRGDRAVDRVLAERPDLLVLDVGLPGRDGFGVCRQLRPAWTGPILMLTARGDEADEIAGLELGADDYLAKPVRPRVLLARVRALLRRPAPPGHPPGPSEALQVGDLTVDPASRRAAVGGAVLDLTDAEFDVLALLASQPGVVLDRRSIHERLLGGAYDGVDRAIDLRVSRLRHKLGLAAAGAGERIRSVRGVGYLYVAE